MNSNSIEAWKCGACDVAFLNESHAEKHCICEYNDECENPVDKGRSWCLEHYKKSQAALASEARGAPEQVDSDSSEEWYNGLTDKYTFNSASEAVENAWDDFDGSRTAEEFLVYAETEMLLHPCEGRPAPTPNLYEHVTERWYEDMWDHDPDCLPESWLPVFANAQAAIERLAPQLMYPDTGKRLSDSECVRIARLVTGIGAV